MPLSSSAFFIAALTSLLTIVNPFSTASLFLTITRGDSKEKKAMMARKAAVTSAVVLIIFAVIGGYILSFFSITVDAFRIAGGILIATVGMNMVRAKREHLSSEKEEKDATDKDDVSIIPLAIPMLSGPGAMTTAIVLMGETSGIQDKISIIIAIIIVAVISYIVLSRASVIDRYLGETGRKVLDRVMGLIVLVVGVQFIINGIGSIILTWGIV